MDADESPMTEEDEQCRDVYAAYGVASYFGQVLEKSLCSFLVLQARLSGEIVTREQLEDFEAKLHKKKTLGVLLKDLEKVVTHNEVSEKIMEEALEKRNFLIHHYFWEHARTFQSKQGRGRMLEELGQYRDLFQRADGLAVALCKAASEAQGIPWAFFEQIYEKLHIETDEEDKP